MHLTILTNVSHVPTKFMPIITLFSHNMTKIISTNPNATQMYQMYHFNSVYKSHNAYNYKGNILINNNNSII